MQVIKRNLNKRDVDIKFDERKPIFDKALQDKNLIFVNIKNEKLPNPNEYEHLYHIDSTNFDFYQKKGFKFDNRIAFFL